MPAFRSEVPEQPVGRPETHLGAQCHAAFLLSALLLAICFLLSAVCSLFLSAIRLLSAIIVGDCVLLPVCKKVLFLKSTTKQRKNFFFIAKTCLLLSRLFSVVLNYLCQLFCVFINMKIQSSLLQASLSEASCALNCAITCNTMQACT